ncbi:MAG TPA: enoyl-CoA hydratase/isomerase family protein, partial [Pirellulaceae bacterium]
CLGGGVALACASDLVVSHASARFAVPAPRRGIVAGLVAPVLAFRTSIGVATRLLLSSEEINGAEAHRLGIVHHLAGTDQVPERTRAVALDFALSAPQSLNLTKRLIYECLGEQLSAQLATGAAMTAASQTTAAAEEGIRAFAEKRLPRWE